MIELQKFFPKEKPSFSPPKVSCRSTGDPLSSMLPSQPNSPKVGRSGVSNKALSQLLQEKIKGISEIEQNIGLAKTPISLTATPSGQLQRAKCLFSEIFSATPRCTSPETQASRLKTEKNSLLFTKQDMAAVDNMLNLPKSLLTQFSFHIFGDTYSPLVSPKKETQPQKEVVNIHVQKRAQSGKKSFRPPTAAGNKVSNDAPFKGLHVRGKSS